LEKIAEGCVWSVGVEDDQRHLYICHRGEWEEGSGLGTGRIRGRNEGGENGGENGVRGRKVPPSGEGGGAVTGGAMDGGKWGRKPHRGGVGSYIWARCAVYSISGTYGMTVGDCRGKIRIAKGP